MARKNPSRLQDKICIECNVAFLTVYGHKRCCGAECTERRRIRLQTHIVCIGCGKEFNPDRHRERKFCSTECWYEFKCPVGSRVLSEKSNPDGYWIVKVPPGTQGSKRFNDRTRWMFEHRYVMQQTLGRALAKSESVHHLNGIKGDNRPENLELWSRPQPTGVRARDQRIGDPWFEGMRA